jgi:hypothetical protein
VIIVKEIRLMPLHLLQEMSKEREHQDCLTLDSMIAAQEKLQSCIINTFGTGSLSEGKEDR